MQDQFGKHAEGLAKVFDSGTHDVSEHWGDDVKRLYEDRGIGTRVGFGTRPALLIIDMSVGFNDPTYRVGADQTVAVTRIATLLHSARECNVPVYFFTTAYERDGRDAGMFGKKIPALLDLQAGDRAVEIDPRLAPIDGEIIITKKFSSAFFETNLLSLLVRDGIDTTILTGCSTSGCVRAAAVDGVSYGYHVIVPEECVSDRADGPHYASLFDINAKYGDVLPLAEVLEYFDTLPKDSAARMSVAH
ncbi:MAG: isochorismatase family protein [Candidatus Dormibacteraceae bacterium]